MKITTIRKDKKSKLHLKVMSFGTLMNSVLEDNKYGDIDNLRSFVRRAESYYTFGHLYRLPYIYPSVEMRQKTDGLMIVKQFNGLLTLTVSTVRDRKEAEDVVYRASALIRSFYYTEKGERKMDECSTHLYDYFLNNSPLAPNAEIKIKWVETPEEIQDELFWGHRLNVYKDKEKQELDERNWGFAKEKITINHSCKISETYDNK